MNTWLFQPPTVPPLQWGVQTLWAELEPLLPGLSVEVVARVESTNAELLQRARLEPQQHVQHFEAPAPQAGRIGRRQADMQPCLLVAEHQTQGRGRLGRAWLSTAGQGLTFSLAMPLAPPDWSGLSLAIGVALAEALQPSKDSAAQGFALGLKWPNDLCVMGPTPSDAAVATAEPADTGRMRKLGGILVETLSAGARRLVVVGVGLNVLSTGATDPPDITNSRACLCEIEPALSPPGALARIARPLVLAMREFESHGFAAFAERYAAHDMLFGKPITTTLASVPEGIARGVSERGELRVELPTGEIHLIGSAEVSVRAVQQGTLHASTLLSTRTPARAS